LISGSLFLSVVDPNLYQRLRNGTFSFGEIETALGLKKPKDASTDQIQYAAMIDWIAWERAISGNGNHPADIPDNFKGYARDVFGHGRAIQWENIEWHFATAFDTYALPNQP
jgi:hypothetical protein